MGGCGRDSCPIATPHHHEGLTAPDGSPQTAIVHHSDRHPRAEVRDSETGEVIFPAVRGPLLIVEGGRHVHEAAEDDIDTCSRCGRDFRDELHLREHERRSPPTRGNSR